MMFDTPVIPRLVKRSQTFLIITAIILCVAALSGVVGYGLGSNHTIHAVVGNQGWLLQSTSANGVTTPVQQNGAVFLWWNIAQAPHNLQADWFVITVTPVIATPLPKSKKPPTVTDRLMVTDIKVDAASNGQGTVTIKTDGNTVIMGTLTNSVMTLIVPPRSTLYPEQLSEFRTLTFVPSNINAFNALVVQGQ